MNKLLAWFVLVVLFAAGGHGSSITVLTKDQAINDETARSPDDQFEAQHNLDYPPDVPFFGTGTEDRLEDQPGPKKEIVIVKPPYKQVVTPVRTVYAADPYRKVYVSQPSRTVYAAGSSEKVYASASSDKVYLSDSSSRRVSSSSSAGLHRQSSVVFVQELPDHVQTLRGDFIFYAEPKPEPKDPQFDCFRKRSGNYPAALCANYFWRCDGNREHRVPCNSQDLFYSPEIDGCVEKMSVPGCRHMQRMLPEDAPCDKHGPSFPAGFYPDPSGDCSRYLFCSGGNFYSVNCPPHQVYDDGRGRCAPPSEVNGICGTARVVPFSCVDRDDGYYRSQADCGVYYKCSHQRIAPFTCPFFFAFDFRTKTCRSQSSVPGCSLPADLNAGERFCRTLQRDDVYADPTNCNQSIVCSRGQAYVFVCAERGRRAFDPEARTCVKCYKGCGDCDDTPEKVEYVVVDKKYIVGDRYDKY